MFSADLNVRPQNIKEVLSHVYFTKQDLTDTTYAQDSLRKILECKGSSWVTSKLAQIWELKQRCVQYTCSADFSRYIYRLKGLWVTLTMIELIYLFFTNIIMN